MAPSKSVGSNSAVKAETGRLVTISESSRDKPLVASIPRIFPIPTNGVCAAGEVAEKTKGERR